MSEVDEVADVRRRLGELLMGRYDIQDAIGRGGMAYVFRAHDVRHDRFVAVKVLKPDLASAIGAERFLREIQTTASFAHPHVLTLIDSGASGDLLYFVMPFIDGESLRQKLSREKQLSLDDALGIAQDVGSALAYAHARGVIHRDIKPENVLLQHGDALVTDFGISLASSKDGHRLTETGMSLGTPSYMSPEQASGERKVDERSDIYSLGCVIYEMLTGEPPHRGATVGATISKMMTERPTAIGVVRDNVPQHVEAAVMRALAKVPGDRFQSVEKFLRSLTDADATSTPVPTMRFPARKKFRPHLLSAAVGGLAVIAIATFVIRPRGGGNIGDTTTTQLTFTGDAEYVSLSPDGSFIAYLTDGRRVMSVQDLEGGGELVLHRSSGPMGPPKWNAEGTRILFSAATTRGDEAALYTIPRLGGATSIRATSRGPGMPTNYAFGVNDSDFVIACCRGRIYVGPNPSAVLQAPEGDFDLEGTADVTSVADLVVEVAMSPDGRFIAFVGGYPNERTVVGVVPVGSSHAVVLASRDGSWFESERLAFNSLHWSGNQLFFAETTGSGARIVAVTVDRRGDAAGAARTVFPSIPLGAQFDVSPRKNRLVFSGGSERSHLEMVERSSPGSRRLGTGTYLYRYPRLSFDGRWLAYHRRTGELVQLMLMSVPDGQPVAVLNDFRPLGPVAWAPNREQLAVMVSNEHSNSLRVVDVRTGAERMIADTVQVGRMLWSPSGEQLTFVKPGVGPRTVRVTDGAEVEAELASRLGREFGGRRRPDGSRDSLRRGSAAPGRLPGDTRGGPEFLPASPEALAGMRIPPLVQAPDGGGFVTYIGGLGGPTGLAIVAADGTRRRITSMVAYPLVWNTQGVIFFVDDGLDGSGATHVHAISAMGGEPQEWMDLPFNCNFANLTLSQDGSRAVCAVSDAVSDVWLIDGVSSLAR